MKRGASFEEQVFDCFKENVGIEGFLKNNFGLVLGKDCRVFYNHFNGSRELDIIVSGNKRLNNGLLVSEDYNIEVQAELCTLGDINNKCSDDYLYSVVSNGFTNGSKSTNKVYSFINFENSGFCEPLINYSCDFCAKRLGESIHSLENIMNSSISEPLKRGVLYYLCDKIVSGEIKGFYFIPSIMQVSAYSDNYRFNLVIDSGVKHPESFSKSYENYVRKNLGKKLSKAWGLKNFKIATLNKKISINSDASEAIVFNKCFSINDYINKVIKK